VLRSSSICLTSHKILSKTLMTLLFPEQFT
jgi:hypothetical protein